MTYLKQSNIQNPENDESSVKSDNEKHESDVEIQKVKMKVRKTPIKVRILMKIVPERRYYRASEKWQKKFCTKVLDVPK